MKHFRNLVYIVAVQASIVVRAMILSSVRFHMSWGTTKFHFQPLIGGPPGLPIHVAVSSDRMGLVMDFVPVKCNDPESILQMIQGNSVEGNIRIQMMNNVMECSSIKAEDVELFVDDVKRSFSRDMNVYTNNCYHFAYHFHCRLQDYTEDK